MDAAIIHSSAMKTCRFSSLLVLPAAAQPAAGTNATPTKVAVIGLVHSHVWGPAFAHAQE